MSNRRLDLADIKALLSSGNRIVQSQGFSSLIIHLKPPFNNAKERIHVLNMFFDCFTNYGDSVSQWCCEAVPCLINSGLMTWEDVSSHCFVKLCSNETSESCWAVLVRTLLHSSPYLTGILPTLQVLICSGLLSHADEVLLLNYVISKAESNDKFLEQFFDHFIWKYPCRFLTGTDLKPFLAKVEDCWAVVASSNELLAETEVCGSVKTFSYLENVSNDRNIVDFMNMWLSLLVNMDITENSITFAAALLPRCGVKMMGKCFKLIQEMTERCPEAVNTVLMLYSMLYAKSYFEIDRRSILKAVNGLFINRFAVTPVVNFLSIVCRQPGEERSIAYDLLCALVSKFPTAFDAVKPLSLPVESDSLDLLECKLRLMAALCISTDRSDELLPSLSLLLKKEAAVVRAAIIVVLALCKEEILDVGTIRKQLGVRVRQTEFEAALAGYCDILATGATASGQDETFAQECVVELWEITQLRKNSSDTEEARRAAWIALGSFDVALIKNVIDVSGSILVDIFKGLSKKEREGFAIFLQKLICAEVESLSRTLYTGLRIRKSTLANIVYTLYNAFGKTNQEAPWFWLATLPLFSVIVGECGEGAKALQATKLMRRLLREVPAEDSNLVNLFAGWRICVATLLSIHAESGDLVRSRDSIVEECRRSLKASELAVNNVVVVLAILTGELTRIMYQLPTAEAINAFETSMRPWVISVLEFIFPIVFDDYKPTTPPIAEVTVQKRCVKTALARSAAWMICSKASAEVRSFFDDDLFARVVDWRIVSKADPEGKLCDLLAGEEMDLSCTIQRSELWLFAAALGADELVTNSLSRSLSCPVDPEDIFENSVVENRTVDELSDFFAKISNLPLRVFQKYERRLKNRFDQICRNAGEEMKKKFYEVLQPGLKGEALGYVAAYCATCALNLVKLMKIAVLPEKDAYLYNCSGVWVCNNNLQGVAAGEKSQCGRECQHELLPTLLGHIRSDGRRLPPLDLQFMLTLIDYWNNEQARLNLLLLAMEQKDAQILYELTSPQLLNTSATFTPYWTTISQNLSALTVLPAFRAKAVLNGLLRFALQNDDEGDGILSRIKDIKRSQVVFDCLLAHVPTFDTSADLMHKTLNSGVVDQRFHGRVSKNFDFWMECSGLAEGKISSLVDRFAEEAPKSNVMLSIFGYCSIFISLQSRLDKLVDLLSVGKMLLSCQRPAKNVEAVLKFLLALICSTCSDIPLHWLSQDVDVLIFARWRYYWKRIVKIPQFCEHFDIIVAFLIPCLLMDDLAPPAHNAVKGMLLYILASQPEIVRRHLEDKHDVWEKLVL
ncbi:unnamed protein product [Haemonchus placei]|uniref:Signal recognition particle 14 kDa protein n=1 Tax=Haemonchus placei TaxID=6290 RepID=A0A158QKV6_HAEPC|nr:unnamed protein product [Haemonchus placei]